MSDPQVLVPNADDLLTSEGSELDRLEIHQLASQGYAASLNGELIIRTASNTQVGAIVNALQCLFSFMVMDRVAVTDLFETWNRWVVHYHKFGNTVRIDPVVLRRVEDR